MSSQIKSISGDLYTNDDRIIDSSKNLGFKNYVINGGFDIWQRGTSFTVNGYTADRWYITAPTGASQVTVTHVITQAGESYAKTQIINKLRIAIPSGGLDRQHNVTTRIENLKQFSGKTCTLSFWVKSTNNILNGQISTVTSNYFDSDAVAHTTVGSINTSSANTWTKIEQTITFADFESNSFGTDNYLAINFVFNDSTDLAEEVEFANVQLEEGDYATAFEHRPPGLELSLCQRYYWKVYDPTRASIRYVHNNASSTAHWICLFQITMRKVPTATISGAGSYSNCNTGVVDSLNIAGCRLKATSTSATTNAQWYNQTIEFDAEF